MSLPLWILREFAVIGVPTCLLRALEDMAQVQNEPTAFRRRVGDWRIFFDVFPELRGVEITDIVRCTSTTYRRR